MKTPRKIVVSRYSAAIIRPKTVRRAEQKGAVVTPSVRQRWRAEYVEAGTVRHTVDGFLTFDEAIAALIRLMAQSCQTVDDVLDFVAGLFSDLSKRSADVSLSRAVWIAARNRKRRHSGLQVQFPAGLEFSREDRGIIGSVPSQAKPAPQLAAAQIVAQPKSTSGKGGVA